MDTSTYNFHFRSADNEDLPQYPVNSTLTKQIEIDQDAAWPLVLREFTHFLSAIYGYDVSERVFVKGVTYDGEVDYTSVSEYE